MSPLHNKLVRLIDRNANPNGAIVNEESNSFACRLLSSFKDMLQTMKITRPTKTSTQMWGVYEGVCGASKCSCGVVGVH